MSLVVDIADALVAALNDPAAARRQLGEPFAMQFQAKRKFKPRMKLQDLKEAFGLEVSVVPKSKEISAARDENDRRVRIDVAVQKHVENQEPSAFDAECCALSDLAEQIERFIGKLKLTHGDGAEADWVRTEVPAIWAADHLAEAQCFTSVLTVTYEISE